VVTGGASAVDVDVDVVARGIGTVRIALAGGGRVIKGNWGGRREMGTGIDDLIVACACSWCERVGLVELDIRH
jgi:hypothetical protein